MLDLLRAVLSLVELRSFVHEWHAVAQHTVDQTGQLGRHSLRAEHEGRFHLTIYNLTKARLSQLLECVESSARS